MKSKIIILLLLSVMPLSAAPARNARPVFIIHVDYAPDAVRRGPSTFYSVLSYLRYFCPW